MRGLRRKIILAAGNIREYVKFDDPEVEKICVANYSWDGRGVTQHDLDNVTKIGTEFSGNTAITSFKELKLFHNLKTINGNAFKDCKNLKALYFPESLTEMPTGSAQWSVFLCGGCSSLTDVQLPSTTTAIPSCCFINCTSLTEIKIPDMVTTIPEACFQGCTALTKINLDNIKILGHSAFYSCTSLNLNDLNHSGLEEIAPRGISETATTELRLPNLKVLDGGNNPAIGFNSKLKAIWDLGQIETVWGSNAHASTGTIGHNGYSFAWLELPETLKAFKGNMYPIRNNWGLRTVVLKAVTPPTCEMPYPIYGNSDLIDLYVPDESLEAYKADTNWNIYPGLRPMSELKLSNDTSYINFQDPEIEKVFAANYDKLNASDSLWRPHWEKNGKITYQNACFEKTFSGIFKNNTTIESFNELQYFPNIRLTGGYQRGEFFGCTNLKEITLPDNSFSIPDYGFAFMNLTKINGLETIKAIGTGAFYYTEQLRIPTLRLPKIKGTLSGRTFDGPIIDYVEDLGQIDTINNFAYSIPLFLKKNSPIFIRLPKTLKAINGNYFLLQSDRLQTIICEAVNPPTLGPNPFEGCTALLSIYVPDASVEAYKAAPNWSTVADKIKPLSGYDPQQPQQ